MRIILVEDHVLLRRGLQRLLEDAGHEVCSAHASADPVLAAVAAEAPDLVLTDVRLPPGQTDEGVRLALELRRTPPPIPVLLLSQYVERRHAADLLTNGDGGLGYLLKDRISDIDTFLAAVDEVAAGATVIDPHVVRQLVRRRNGSALDRLTPREREVLALVAEGRSNRAISAQLVLSASAVEKHIANIFDKLDLLPDDTDRHRRVRAAVLWLDHMASDPPQPEE
jgi:DNA-binding NarL/FixJ family response regulator